MALCFPVFLLPVVHFRESDDGLGAAPAASIDSWAAMSFHHPRTTGIPIFVLLTLHGGIWNCARSQHYGTESITLNASFKDDVTDESHYSDCCGGLLRSCALVGSREKLPNWKSAFADVSY